MMLADSEFPEIESVSNRTWDIDERMAEALGTWGGVGTAVPNSSSPAV